MNLTELHRRLLADVLAVGDVYPLVLTGGYAVQAHGLVDRLSKDLDVATENPEPMEKIAAAVRAGLEQRSWQVRALETDPLSARLIVTDTSTGEACEVDVLKEALWRPPVRTQDGLVLSLEDVVGTKVRALADRGLARELIDVRAATDRARDQRPGGDPGRNPLNGKRSSDHGAEYAESTGSNPNTRSHADVVSGDQDTGPPYGTARRRVRDHDHHPRTPALGAPVADTEDHPRRPPGRRLVASLA